MKRKHRKALELQVQGKRSRGKFRLRRIMNVTETTENRRKIQTEVEDEKM
jgi:hypothetical protein